MPSSHIKYKRIRYCQRSIHREGNVRPQAFSTDRIFKRVCAWYAFFCAFFKEKQKTYVWIYIPSEFYPSVQELEASSLDLNLQSKLLEHSVISRSKPLLAKSWLAPWKKKDWQGPPKFNTLSPFLN